MSINDIDKFGHKEMMKKGPLTKNTWYAWLFNYIPKPLKKALSSVKDIITSLFITSTTKYYSKLTRVTNVYGDERKTRK